MMKKIVFGISIWLISYAVVAADSWEAKVTSVRTCKHPTTSATLIQIDFDKQYNPDLKYSIVLADNDYSATLFSHYMSTALTGYSTGNKLKVSGANAYSYSYCDGQNSTHSAGSVHLALTK